MMRGLLYKSLHEVWLTTLLCGFGLLTIIAILTFILPQIVEGMSEMFEQMPFVKSLVTALLGTEVGEQITAPRCKRFCGCIPWCSRWSGATKSRSAHEFRREKLIVGPSMCCSAGRSQDERFTGWRQLSGSRQECS